MTARSGIIWLASFPKSGNTWFRIFLANLTAGENGPVDINDLNERGDIASSRQEFEAATLLDSGLMSHDDIDRLRPRVYAQIAAEATEQLWIKVHDAYTLTADGEPMLGRGVARAAVYLVRDPRDVAISLAYHNRTTIDDSIKLMNAADAAQCRAPEGLAPQLRQKLQGWSGHVTSWLDQTDVPVHVIRYEDLVAAPAERFSSALIFTGRSATSDEIQRAVRHSDFAELQHQEKIKGFAEQMSRTTLFFRAGRIGGWRETLKIEHARAIEQHHGDAMARLGYRLEVTSLV